MTAKKETRILILDVSALVFRAFFALPPLTASDGKPAGALYGFLSILLKTVQERKPTHIVAAIDLPGKTFRHELYEAYKATRPETPEDLRPQFPMVYEALEALGIPVLGAKGFEADDVIATVVKKMQGEEKTARIEIESGDQDLLQLVDEQTIVLAPGRSASDIRVMDSAAVETKLGIPPDRVVEYKTLRGDASDNIPGVRGIGPKTATALLTYADSLETLLLEAKAPKEDAPKELVRFAERLLDSRKEMLRDREVITLRDDAPITFVLKEAVVKRFPEPAFSALLKRWGFETLLKRFSGPTATVKQKKAEQGSLVLREEPESLEDFIEAQEKQVRKEIKQKASTDEFSEAIARLERAIVPIISKMERQGILLDKKALGHLDSRLTKKKKKIEKNIFAAVGHEFNLASPKQLAVVLYDEMGIQARKKTAGGQRSTAAGVLEELREDEEIIKDILDWREVHKLLSTYIETLPNLVAKDGRIHAKFWQLGTTTGRIASSDPNLQNIPIRTEDGKEVRNAFIAPKGSVLVSADYSQVELRVVAVMAEEDAMIEAFSKGADIHSVTAERVFHVSADEVTADMRRHAKMLNFGMLYGMGVRAVSKQMGVDLKEASAFRDGYFKAFPKLTTWMERVVEDARETGFTETVFGRRRFFPELHTGNPGLRASAERAAINAPVQGTATGDLVKMGMVALTEAKLPVDILVQVHDEVLCEVKEKDLDGVLGDIRKHLENVWPDAPVDFPVKLSVGPSWGELTIWEA